MCVWWRGLTRHVLNKNYTKFLNRVEFRNFIFESSKYALVNTTSWAFERTRPSGYEIRQSTVLRLYVLHILDLNETDFYQYALVYLCAKVRVIFEEPSASRVDSTLTIQYILVQERAIDSVCSAPVCPILIMYKRMRLKCHTGQSKTKGTNRPRIGWNFLLETSNPEPTARWQAVINMPTNTSATVVSIECGVLGVAATTRGLFGAVYAYCYSTILCFTLYCSDVVGPQNVCVSYWKARKTEDGPERLRNISGDSLGLRLVPLQNSCKVPEVFTRNSL